jgi:hypothetical protein
MLFSRLLPSRLFPLAASLGLLVLACESSSDAPRARAAAVHPDFPVRPSPEMIAQSNIGMRDDARRDDDAGAPPAAPPKHWNASCLVHRACPVKERPIPTCEKDKAAPSWSVLQISADSQIGKTVEVKGELGIAPVQANSNSKCAPDTCCHALRMAITLDGRPLGLPLAGLGCSGDDSKLCCNVPANGQSVIAHGRLAKAPAGGVAKWQLEDVSLCEPEVPEGPDH